jgi:hypothetical protein
LRRRIDLGGDITLRDCAVGDPIRESPYPLVLDGHGHTLRQACFEKRLLRQDGTGYLDVRDVTLTRGGADGPGAALTSRGEITIRDSVVKQNLSEEPGGGVFSMRRVTVLRSRINGNLANDDGGGVYARRGGVQVYDSVLSNNLVDGSGGAVGSTGDILVVRSQVDGNTTDGDGGALYTDEDGDVTVVESLVDGSDADGPGGAIFTLDGDVAVVGSTLIGNRADDRGGAVSGEADVLLVNSTVARNLAVAHAGGGVWARGNLMLVNSTVADNYAEGEGGGTLAAGRTTLLHSTVTSNIASVGGNVGSAGTLVARGTIIGPSTTEGVTGDTLPTRRDCRVYASTSQGYNFLTDDSCELADPRDVTGDDPRLENLEDDPKGFVLLPRAGSPVLGRVPAAGCAIVLPDSVPAGQLVSRFVDWDRLLRRDAIGTLRDDGTPCDVGAVERPPDPSPVAGSFDGRVVGGAPADDEADGPPVRRGTGRSLLARPGTGPVLPGDALRAAASGAVADLDARVTRLLARVADQQQAAGRFTTLLDCTRPLRVDQVGDPQHRWGFRYDERDGSGPDTRTALVPHAGRSRADLRLLRLARTRRCLSTAPDPNGSGAPAFAPTLSSPTSAPTRVSLARRLSVLRSRIAAVERLTDRFDAWESCLTWLPVTEDGDTAQDLGFVRRGATGPHRTTAVDVDATEWDDPDYQLLAFVGDDRPFGPSECDTEPGEAGDVTLPRSIDPPAIRLGTPPALAAAPEVGDLRRAVSDATEDVEDLAEPVDDVTRFDECMYTVGLRSRSGYRYRSAAGRTSYRSALSFDLRGSRPAQTDVMAFPGEEPPQIECNEDAGGESTDE